MSDIPKAGTQTPHRTLRQKSIYIRFRTAHHPSFTPHNLQQRETVVSVAGWWNVRNEPPIAHPRTHTPAVVTTRRREGVRKVPPFRRVKKVSHFRRVNNFPPVTPPSMTVFKQDRRGCQHQQHRQHPGLLHRGSRVPGSWCPSVRTSCGSPCTIQTALPHFSSQSDVVFRSGTWCSWLVESVALVPHGTDMGSLFTGRWVNSRTERSRLFPQTMDN